MLCVIQSWDDGVVDDIRLTDIVRKHNARAAFNLNPGLHESSRGHGWKYGDKEVLRLSRDELVQTYEGFEIANHTMTHPDLCRIESNRLVAEIVDARKVLQDWFGQPVDGFCYPYGRSTVEAQNVVESSGHRFARDAVELKNVASSDSFRLVQPHCHFTDPAFWVLFNQALENGSYFFFWGHSYEMTSEKMWNDFESAMERISRKPLVRWMTPGEYIRSLSDQAKSKSRK